MTIRPDPPAHSPVAEERFLLSQSLPEAVALNIVEDGLPDELRSKPTAIYTSPEVPLQMTDEERTELLSGLAEVKPAERELLMTQFAALRPQP